MASSKGLNPGTKGGGAWARYLIAGMFVLGWIGAGFAIRASPNAYLLLGVPLVVFFQIAVARRPLREVWFADASALRMPPWCWAVALAFMVLPACGLSMGRHPSWAVRLWYVAAMAGAVPLAASLPKLNRNRVEYLKLCFCTAGLMASAIMALGLLRARDSMQPQLLVRLAVFGRYLALYLPVSFVLEEVFFRGALDSYLRRVDDSEASAIYVSALWGLWHFPAVAGLGRPGLVAGALGVIIFFHSIIGRYLSIYWRRSGLLLVPAFSHAFADAVRNALRL